MTTLQLSSRCAQAFEETDALISEAYYETKGSRNMQDPGCTATCVMLTRNYFVFANLGDSRAMLCSGVIFNAIRDGSGFFQHGHTYLGHPMAAAGSLAVMETLLDDDLLAQVPVKGNKLQAALQEALGGHQNVGDLRGRGLFRGIELVKDRPSKDPFDPAQAIHKKIKAAAFDMGLLCYPMGGTLDGHRGDHILLAPPFIISDAEIDHLVGMVTRAIEAVLPR